MTGKTVSQMQVGEKSSITKTVSESDVLRFAEITGDYNPFHVNEEYAKKTVFQGRIVHGLLLGGLISSVIGGSLPGPGSIYVSQGLRFLAPAKIGETLCVEVIVTKIEIEKNRVHLQTFCTNQDGKKVVEGEAVVSPKKL